ncbi:MAG: AAA family ATPase [Myxococcaceae bacterium]|nr:AAA family ATPase [Myxococcaceae bacterium]
MNAPASHALDVSFSDAASAFRRFFVELRDAFLEREALFTQIELGLLCREHCLIIGPPGTAKSAVASAVLGRIVDEKSNRPSLFSKQLAENTVQTDLIGPVDFKVLTETGRTEYLTEEGMLGAVHAFLDEIFDGRDMLLRSILNVLHERELKHGRKVTAGRCECAVMTSNRYLSEVLQRSPETLQAFADRISFICFAPRGFARKQSRAQMLWRASAGQRPSLHERLTLQQLDVLQEAVASVEVPPVVTEGLEVLADTLEKELVAQVTRLPDYVPTKYFSQRTMVKALWALKAAVVRDRMYRRADRKLVAEVGDLTQLDSFFLLGGPKGDELEALLKGAADPRERAQLEIIRVEHKAFDEALAKVRPMLEQAAEREAAELQMRDDLASAEAMTRTWSPAVASTVAAALRDKLLPGPRHPENRSPLVRAAECLLTGLDSRTAKGLSAQSEARGGLALLVSFNDVLELVRKVPELQARVPAVATNVREYCRQASELIALAAESAEFEENLRVEGIAGLASNIAEELTRLGEVLQTCAVAGAGDDDVRGTLARVRERVAVALRRRATRAFVSPAAGRKIEPLEQLTQDSRRLRDLETSLVELSAAQKGLREELLTPLGEAYAREALTTQSFNRLEQLVRTVEAVVENLRREGASAEVCVRGVRELIEGRVKELARVANLPPKLAGPEGAQVVSGEAYQAYRQQLAAPAPDGDLLAFRNLTSLLNGLGAPALPPPLRDALATGELTWLLARARYLRAWLTQLLQRLPAPDQVKDRGEADRAFEVLLKSRLPMLVTREGELVKLKATASRLASEPGERGETAKKVEASLELIAEEFQVFSRQLLDARVAR